MSETEAFQRLDPETTARIAYLMKENCDEDDPVCLRSKRLVESSLDNIAKDAESGYYVASNGERTENDIYHLTHLILTPLIDMKRRVETSYEPRDTRKKKIAKAIAESQRADGGWRPSAVEK